MSQLLKTCLNLLMVYIYYITKERICVVLESKYEFNIMQKIVYSSKGTTVNFYLCIVCNQQGLRKNVNCVCCCIKFVGKISPLWGN